MPEPQTTVTRRDREAAKKVLGRCAAEFGYDGNRPYTEMLQYVAEAIAEARGEVPTNAMAQIGRMQDFISEQGLSAKYDP